MRYLTPCFALLSITGGLFLVTAEFHPECLRTLGIDWGFADVQDARETLKMQEVLRNAFNIQNSQAVARFQKRRQIVEDLLAGRLELFAAAAAFHQLNQQDPVVEKELARQFPRMSPGERACRHVLRWVKEESKYTPGCRDLHARLEAQLQEHVRSHPEVNLPELPAEGRNPDRPRGEPLGRRPGPASPS
jgi:hypothetical protein